MGIVMHKYDRLFAAGFAIGKEHRRQPAHQRVSGRQRIGCGACRTGAASYALPPEDALMRRLRAMLAAYREAGGERAIVLVHDDPHGTPLIDALARFGD